MKLPCSLTLLLSWGYLNRRTTQQWGTELQSTMMFVPGERKIQPHPSHGFTVTFLRLLSGLLVKTAVVLKEMTAADPQNSSLHELLSYFCPHSFGTKLAVRVQAAKQTAESVQVCPGSTKQRLQTKKNEEPHSLPGKGKKFSHSRIHLTQAWPARPDGGTPPLGISFGLIPYFLIL